MLRIIILTIALSFAAGSAASEPPHEDLKSSLKLASASGQKSSLKTFCETTWIDALATAGKYKLANDQADPLSHSSGRFSAARNQWLQNLANLAIIWRAFCKRP
mgnify:CR=1 FL=1